MITLVESPRVAFVSGSSLPGSSPFSLSRLILPFLCIAIGVSVGTATGLTLALVNASNNALAASDDSAQTSTPATEPTASLAASAKPVPVTQPAAIAPAAAPMTANATQPPAAAPSSAAIVPEARPSIAPSTANVTIKAHRAPVAQVALNRSLDAVRPATIKMSGKEWHVARLMSMPDSQPAPEKLASVQLTIPASLDVTPSSLDAPAKPASVYTEGDIAVVDYDAAAGTIQTNDGRTFVLGTTVAAGFATPWETYRSDVHYRCDQNGSCVLMRTGVVAPNAKLI